MDNRPPRRGSFLPRMPRGGVCNIAHSPQPRMSQQPPSWNNNNYASFQQPDETVNSYQSPVMETYNNFSHPHPLPSPDSINTNTQSMYQGYPNYYVPPGHTPPLMPVDMSQMYMQIPPTGNLPPPSMVNTNVPHKKSYTAQDQKFLCSKCYHTNYLLENEFRAKEIKIKELTAENNLMHQKLQEMEQELRYCKTQRNASSEIAVEQMAHIENANTPSSQLSPDAVDFYPKNTEPALVAVAPVSDVPVVSAKSIGEPVCESSAEAEEEPQAEDQMTSEVPPDEPSYCLESDTSQEASGCSVSATAEIKTESCEVKSESTQTKDATITEIKHELDPQEEIDSGDMLIDTSKNENPELQEDNSEWQDQYSPELQKEEKSSEPQTDEAIKPLSEENSWRTRQEGKCWEPSSGSKDYPDHAGQFRTNNNNRSGKRRGNDQGPNMHVGGRGKNGRRSGDYDQRNQGAHNDKPHQNFPQSRNMNEKGFIGGGNAKIQNNSRYQMSKFNDNRDVNQRESLDKSNTNQSIGKDIPSNKYQYISSNKDSSRDQREGGYAKGGPRNRPRDDGYQRDTHSRDRENENIQHQNYNFTNKKWDKSNDDYKGRNDNTREQNSGASNRHSNVRNLVKEIKGDLFSAPNDVSLAHCVAKDFRMGSGIAVRFKDEFKRVPELMDQNVDVGGCAFLQDSENQRYIFYLVTKSISSGKPTYNTLRNSLEDLKEKCLTFNVTKLAVPHIGCGLDKLAWPNVRRIINEVFQDANIEISAYDFNAEGLPESEGNRPPNKKVGVQYRLMNLVNIDHYTILLFFGTEDGHMDSTAKSLDNRFHFEADYKKATKNVGKTVLIKKTDYFIFSLIVSKSFNKDKLRFTDIEECAKDLVRYVRKEKDFAYVGIEAFMDWSEDSTFTEKVGTILRNILPKARFELWICYREQAHDFHNMTQTRKPAVNQP